MHTATDNIRSQYLAQKLCFVQQGIITSAEIINNKCIDHIVCIISI